MAKNALEWTPTGKEKREALRHTWKCTRMLEHEEKGLSWRKASLLMESHGKH